MFASRLLLATAVCGFHFAAAAATGNGMPSISSAGLVNAATGEPVLAPYSICTIYGANLYLHEFASATGDLEAPDTLGGDTVLIGSVPAGLFYITENQINFLIPNSLTPGTYSITVVRQGVASQTVPITIQEVAPGLFAATPGFAAATHADGTPVTVISPAVPGEVVVFYATGLGRTQPDPRDRYSAPAAAPLIHLADFQVLFDGVAIDSSLIQYAGVTPNSPGLYQVNVRLPDNLSPDNPEVRLSVAGSLSPLGLSLITGAVEQGQARAYSAGKRVSALPPSQ